MLNKLYHKGAEIKSAFLNGVNVFGSSEVPVEPSEDMGLAKDYSGTGWYKATDTGTVFSKDVPALETHVFEEGGLEYVSVYTKEDAKLYGERAAVSNMTNMNSMFSEAKAFNQDISNWDVSSVTDMGMMFVNATSFNQDISNWDTSNVTNMSYMFYGVTSFNSDLSNWNVSSVTNMSLMFQNATSFNQDISVWDVSSVTKMAGMFVKATSFNQDLSVWCVPLIPARQSNFDSGATAWTLPRPVWGTCPRGENISA